ncbi:DUF4185 domain-containing protein [Tsukamurella sp. 8F]|uniref:DUF4185 domain-containing protein n=1 Tax=unclassified Tsukamurella TaxID=2633480 RepID=UPI0023B965B5|nr:MULTISPECIES: DUF4185 domain-containing protein [unclassified Tsukamurella]MDF0531589.1 DUF4185 domain-containing protein [Tsukamurella sp. 8J]MDF0587564.1 DUF4185 domain-containing protein [Tsukamurella sp. 8F]
METFTKLADITGVPRFGVGGTDLGIPCRVGDEILYLFGDTFGGPSVGAGDWRSPVGLFGDASGRMTRAAGPDPDSARQLIDYRHDNGRFTTIIPTSCINLSGTLYMHAMVMAGLGRAVGTGIWRSDDAAASWRQVARFRAHADGGCRQMWSMRLGRDGYVYSISTGGLSRDKGLRLHRLQASRFDAMRRWRPMRWEAWERGAWGRRATDLGLGSGYGELHLDELDSGWVLTYFDAAGYRIAVRFADRPDGEWSEPVTLVQGTSWADEDHARGRVAQLYGGYLVPGSTLDDARLVVSQWNTAVGEPYRSMMFEGSLGACAA